MRRILCTALALVAGTAAHASATWSILLINTHDVVLFLKAWAGS